MHNKRSKFIKDEIKNYHVCWLDRQYSNYSCFILFNINTHCVMHSLFAFGKFTYDFKHYRNRMHLRKEAKTSSNRRESVTLVFDYSG